MQTQKDHVHAYQFMMRRMDTAFVTGDPDEHETPGRRQWNGLLIGLVVALLVGVGFGVYGLIRPGGNTAWTIPGAILMEKESGVRYVMINGVLRPTPNQASAMLIQGQRATMHSISRSSLGDLPRGSLIGIRGAPDAVPAPGSLLPGRWLLCPATGGGLSVNMDDQALIDAVPDDRYVPVEAPNGALYLVWRGTKYRLPDVQSRVALGLTTTLPVKANDLWLGLIPEGAALNAAVIPQAGRDGLEIAGQRRKVGDLFVHKPANGTEQHYVLRADGLASMSVTEYALLAAHSARPAVQIDASAVVSARFSPDPTLLNRLPDLVPQRAFDPFTGGPCIQQIGTGADVITSGVVIAQGAANWPSVDTFGALVRPTRGTFVAEVPLADKQRVPNRYLITDQGKRYFIPDNDSITALGLSGMQPVPMRTEVLSMIPAGPALTRTAVVSE
ncbi:type VII secretion protein EccB [Kibdelosporangium philippinense]|uniref:Type VII secretion protein EccB n=1 Tax=Kibdelosporangium philippinense TaxID=211113 RepID=A0ABS8ZEY2_9PSEU|nr:type VII secretion protein EccB [Kibdelosporangium philippinense]MCE7006375.1 type VII secretion protein EccB [Kibdelosporangium philippinense]